VFMVSAATLSQSSKRLKALGLFAAFVRERCRGHVVCSMGAHMVDLHSAPNESPRIEFLQRVNALVERRIVGVAVRGV